MKKGKSGNSGLLNDAWLGGVIGVLVAVIAYLTVPGDEFPQAPAMAAVVALMAVWWILEVVPIPVTSLFPLVLLPLFGISDAGSVAVNYGKSTIFLFLGGFLLALGLQESGLHKRIALHILRRVGSRPAHLVLGFMIATGLLSMWISNTATVMVMLPIALSVLGQSQGPNGKPPDNPGFAVALMLGIAYSADIGGMATLVGTPPNLAYREIFSGLFPLAPETGFLQWMMMGLPMSIVFMSVGWFLLTKVVFRLPGGLMLGGKGLISKEIKDLGPVRRDEWVSGIVFGIAAFLWMTGSDLQLGDSLRINGWRSLTGLTGFDDAAVAIAASILLFILPSQKNNGFPLLKWKTARKVPWGILLLFGGGFAIADGFMRSGLSELTGKAFSGMVIGSPALLVGVVCLVLTFMTEITSNTAITNLTLPVLAKASVALGLDPRILMIPATLSASCAFMMPVASPTQAIVFGSGHVTIRQMIRAGIWFNLLGILLVTIIFLTLGMLVFGIDPSVVPQWAELGESQSSFLR